MRTNSLVPCAKVHLFPNRQRPFFLNALQRTVLVVVVVDIGSVIMTGCFLDNRGFKNQFCTLSSRPSSTQTRQKLFKV